MLTKITITILLIASLLFVSVLALTDGQFALVALFAIFGLLALSFTTYLLTAKRITQLHQYVNRISASKNLTIKNMPGDEIHSIQSHIEALLQHFQETDNLSKTNIQKSMLELKTRNRFLEDKLLEHQHTENLKMDSKYLVQFDHRDHVTSLPNGIFFNEVLNKAINHARRRSQTLAVLLLNIDSFKTITEKMGATHSDLILSEMGKRFINVLRKEDVLAKLDGDEFIILLSDIHKPKFASTVAGKLLAACSQLLKLDNHEFTVTASIGICIYPNDGEALEDLLENANIALYQAKKAGGNVYQFHKHELHIEAQEYTQLESALSQAIHNNELALYYQPKYRIKTGTITGVEVLMRWEHPTLGIISPVHFIQLAEESGRMMEIGEWALREACERIKYWEADGYEHLTVSLKLSPKQFQHPDIVNVISKIFSSVSIDPHYIEFEITEKTIMENIEASAIILEKLKSTGVQIAIDHFGTGYTSISYLKKFPINSIKIDQSYIRGVPNNPNDTAITSALIALAHQLGLEVVAEGVETAEQIQFLSSHQCDIVQGYFLSHPLTAQKIVLQFKKLREEVLF